MLDSLVRVSRRVGGAADINTTETPAETGSRSRLRQSQESRRLQLLHRGLRQAHRSGRNGSSHKVQKKCSYGEEAIEQAGSEDPKPARPPTPQPESFGRISRAPPFTTTQFHVLLNSLFKVLFNFPSRYLFAIGLGVIFSLTWSLPRTLTCTPKQVDSKQKPAQLDNSPTGLSPSTAYGPSQGVLGPVVEPR